MNTQLLVSIIASSMAFLGFILTKENKVSEFRQQWINDFRSELSELLTALNDINNQLPSINFNYSIPPLLKNLLTRLTLKIKLRLNPKESDTDFKKALDEVEKLLKNPRLVTKNKVNKIINNLETSGHKLFKEEWERVKRGEPWYYRSKLVAFLLLGLLLSIASIIGVLNFFDFSFSYFFKSEIEY